MNLLLWISRHWVVVVVAPAARIDQGEESPKSNRRETEAKMN
jgi:hypothetical protein